MSEENYYQVLKADPKIPQALIEGRYGSALNMRPNSKQSIIKAYSVLSNAEYREIYDQHLKKEGHEYAVRKVQEKMNSNERKTKPYHNQKELSDNQEGLDQLNAYMDLIILNLNTIFAYRLDFNGQSICKSTMDNFIKLHQIKRTELEVFYELGENSEIYKLLMSGNEKTIARLIDEMSKNHEFNEGQSLNLKAIAQNSPPELIAKMAEIGQKVADRQNEKVNSLDDALNKFCNGFKQAIKILLTLSLADIGIKKDHIKNALTELENVSKIDKGYEETISGDFVGKFTSKLQNSSKESTNDIRQIS